MAAGYTTGAAAGNGAEATPVPAQRGAAPAPP